MLRPKCKISPTNKDLAIKIFVSSMIFRLHNISLTVHGSEIKPLIMQLCFDKDITLPLPFLCSPPDHCRFCLFEGPPVPYPYKTFLTSHLSVQSKSLGLCGITKLQDPCSAPTLPCTCP